MTSKRIFLSPPDVGPLEREYLLAAFDSNWIAPLGPHVDAFETEMATRIGVASAAALSSGTAALHLSLLLAGVRPSDRVICSDLTFAASANAIVYCGAIPVFIDSEKESWNIDPDLLEEALSSLAREGTPARAVLAVDLYGQCADYSRLLSICNDHDVALIEDAAEALGASFRDRPAGAFGRMSVLSFNGNKIITTSGGGMLLSDDPELVRRARFLATQARDAAPHYEHSEVGYNYRMSNLLAALGRAQLRTLDERVERRRRIFDRYRAELEPLDGVEFLPEMNEGRSNRWLTVLTIDPAVSGVSREDVRLALERENIEARPVWKPLHLQPLLAGAPVRGGAVAADLFEGGVRRWRNRFEVLRIRRRRRARQGGTQLRAFAIREPL